MTSRDFVYWIQGLFELAEPLTLNKKQVELIRKHLNMVFIHEIDPSMGDSEHQGKLTAAHHNQIVVKLNNTPNTIVIPTLPEVPPFLTEAQLSSTVNKIRC